MGISIPMQTKILILSIIIVLFSISGSPDEHSFPDAPPVVCPLLFGLIGNGEASLCFFWLRLSPIPVFTGPAPICRSNPPWLHSDSVSTCGGASEKEEQHM